MKASANSAFKAMITAAGAGLCLSLIGTSFAQERLPVRGGNGLNEDRAGATFLKSGAMIFIAFDRNLDLEITHDEIEAGARLAFRNADQDGNEVLTPIEQRNWAARFAGENDVIANPRLFPAATPNQVTEDEFVQGMLTLSQRFENDEGRIMFETLTLGPGRERGDRENGGADRLLRPNIADRSGANR